MVDNQRLPVQQEKADDLSSFFVREDFSIISPFPSNGMMNGIGCPGYRRHYSYAVHLRNLSGNRQKRYGN